MKTINLRDHYSHYTSDYLLEVADEIAICLGDFKRFEHAHLVRRLRYKAFYSLDREDGIEGGVLLRALPPQEVLERKLSYQELYTAIAGLPDKQAKRIYAYFFLGMSKRAIAEAEGVTESAVRYSIERGFRNIHKSLKGYT